jgi:prepilin-type N-terminal cleavage/methylation domain-containing protein
MQNKNINRTFRQAFTLIEMLIVMSIIGLLAALTLGISSSVMRNSEIRQTENGLKVLSMAMQEWELEMGRSITFKGVAGIEDQVDGGIYDIDRTDMNNGGGLIGYPVFNGQAVEDAVILAEMRSRNIALIRVLSEAESSKDILSKIEPDHFCKTSGTAPDEIHTSDLCNIDGTHSSIVVDAWGTPIGIVFPGKYFVPGDFNDEYARDSSGDLTVRDQIEDGLGSCVNQRPYFVSAGPDGKWGYRYQAGTGPSGDDLSMTLWSATLDNIYSYKPFIVEEAR